MAVAVAGEVRPLVVNRNQPSLAITQELPERTDMSKRVSLTYHSSNSVSDYFFFHQKHLSRLIAWCRTIFIYLESEIICLSSPQKLGDAGLMMTLYQSLLIRSTVINFAHDLASADVDDAVG